MNLSANNINKISEILKKRFPYLTVQETINLSCDIIQTLSVEEQEQK